MIISLGCIIGLRMPESSAMSCASDSGISDLCIMS